MKTEGFSSTHNDADISKGSTYRPIVIAIMAMMENNNKSKINLIRNPFFPASFASDDFTHSLNRKTTPSSSSVMPFCLGGALYDVCVILGTL